jgi:hypothetical protein
VYEPVMKGIDEWVCEFRILGLPQEIVDQAYGVDSMQALALSFQWVRVRLEGAGQTLTWLDGEPGDVGIPPTIPSGYGLAVEQHLMRVMDEEVTRLVEAARAGAHPRGGPTRRRRQLHTGKKRK